MRRFTRIVSFLAGCFIICIITIASNSKWSDELSTHLPNVYRYGDLFLFSNMPGYKIPVDNKKISIPFKIRNSNITLTIIGDSYMNEFDSTSFCAGEYKFAHWNDIMNTVPAPHSNKTNILIIETTERYCRWRLRNTHFLLSDIHPSQAPDAVEIKLSAEDNLQYIVTNLAWAIPFKELKAYIYLKCFDRFDTRVAKPDGSGRLFLEETINPQKSSSSYNPVSDNEINSITDSMNLMSENMQKMGFGKVCFSIIPNSASLYHTPELPYNNIIERIQSNPNLHVQYIDSYHLLKRETASVFYRNDSHWNTLGKTLWLKEVNAWLCK